MPNGIVSAAQARLLGEITRQSGRNVADVTTRQQVQLRWLTMEGVPEVMARLEAAGLTSLQTGMDNIRGIVGCPVTGLTARELFDTAPIAREFQRLFVGNKAFTNLPRKFNVTITGCPDNCTTAETQDIAMTPAVAGPGRRRDRRAQRGGGRQAGLGRAALRHRARRLRPAGGGRRGLRRHRPPLPRPRAAGVAEQVSAGLPPGRVGRRPRFRAALEARLGRAAAAGRARRAHHRRRRPRRDLPPARARAQLRGAQDARWAASPATSSSSWRAWPRCTGAASSASRRGRT